MATHISLFGSPGSGKSTTAAGLFYEMKKSHKKVEITHEYAKDLTYKEDYKTLSDQIMVFANQHHKCFILDSNVDFVISDGPFLLSAIFSEYSDHKHLPLESFDQLVIDTYKMYDTINIFLNPADVEYQEYGRNETQEEALAIGEKIKKVMRDNDIPYLELQVDDNIINNVLSLLDI